MRKRFAAPIALLAGVVLVLGTACRSGEVKTAIGVDGRTIKLGELSPLSGPVKVIGEPLTNGHRVYFQYVNEVLGGVGRDLPENERYKVELVERDTEYNPQKHVQRYNEIKDEVLMIAQSLGTPTTQAIVADLTKEGILTAPATLSAAWLKQKYLVPAGAPYAIQFVNAAQHIKDQGGEFKAGIIYQDDDYGQEGINGLEFAAEKLGFEIVARAPYKPTDQEFGAQVGAMRRAGATHVFLTAVPSATGPIIGTAAAQGYLPQWIGQSPSWIGALAKSEQLLPVLQAKYWVVTDASCAWGETGEGCEGMKEMVENVQRFGQGQEPDYYFQFGYTQARIVHQILEKAVADGDLTREGILKAFEGLKDVNMGGLLNPISYGSKCEDKVPATASTIWGVDPSQPIALKEIATVDSSIGKDYPFCA